MNHYVYKITDPVTDQYYFGVRSCTCDIDSDDYMGSMSKWEPEDVSRLEKEIINTFDDREVANKFEASLIKKHWEDDLNENYMVNSPKMHRLKEYTEDHITMHIRVTKSRKKRIWKAATELNMGLAEYVRYALTKKMNEGIK